ncbi:hypothetical protein CCP3SC1_140002 [Gammaproteobacteria bacterium]
MREIKKQEHYIEAANQSLLKRLHADDIVVDIQKVEGAEVDEMWSYSKATIK